MLESVRQVHSAKASGAQTPANLLLHRPKVWLWWTESKTAPHHQTFQPMGRDQGGAGGLPLLLKGRTQKLYLPLPLPSHGQNTHTAIPSCKGSWEVSSRIPMSHVPS